MFDFGHSSATPSGHNPNFYSHARLPFRESKACHESCEIREEIIDILGDIAPDENLDDLVDDKSFRDQLELDSMDFLDIVMELRKRHRVQIPEEDYGNLASMHSTVTYLEPKMRDIVKS